MEVNTITLCECYEIFEAYGLRATINDGKVVDFRYEKSTASDGKSEQC